MFWEFFKENANIFSADAVLNQGLVLLNTRHAQVVRVGKVIQRLERRVFGSPSS
jgi:hypothetical protein